jgi:CheY-like chemotaxis protein
MTSHTIILAAEDEESDAFFLGMALKKAGIRNRLVIARDGQEAVEYLKGDGIYSDRDKYPLPKLLLLDLKMPRMGGFGVLAWRAAHPAFKDLPAVVLSSSAQVADVEKARQLGASDYCVKPNNLKDLTRLVQELAARWLQSAREPDSTLARISE